MSLGSKGGTFTITGTEAPHSAKSTEEKIRYYKDLREIDRTDGNHLRHFIVGDFNAKLFTRHPEEADHIGTFIFDLHDHDIEDVLETQLGSREMLVDFFWKKIT